MVLRWKDEFHSKTVPIEKDTNVGNLQLAPGYERAHAFATIIEDQKIQREI